MRITWHEHVLILLALLNEHVEKLDGETSDLLKLVAHIQFQIHQHLVVAAASAMDLLAYIAQAAGKNQLHLRMHILNAFFDLEVPCNGICIDLLHLGKEHIEFVFLKQADAFEHCDMSHRAKHVEWSEIEIHFPISSNRIAFDVFVNLDRFFPKFHRLFLEDKGDKEVKEDKDNSSIYSCWGR